MQKPLIVLYRACLDVFEIGNVCLYLNILTGNISKHLNKHQITRFEKYKIGLDGLFLENIYIICFCHDDNMSFKCIHDSLDFPCKDVSLLFI